MKKNISTWRFEKVDRRNKTRFIAVEVLAGTVTVAHNGEVMRMRKPPIFLEACWP